jgi:nitrilase
MTTYSAFTLAAIQAAPILFDRDASTEKACHLIQQAADKGATIAAFGETWLPGYPFFAFAPLSSLGWKAASEYLANAVEIPSPTTDRLCDAAKQAGIDVVIGVVELDARTRGTVYCTLLFIGREGRILGRHRKLKPTLAERMVWGEGDTTGLRVYERPYARVSGLNCWEHQMMLPGYALAAQGTQIHVAAWPGRETAAPPAPVSVWPRQLLLSRAFAAQAAAYVICVAGLRLPEHVPERYAEINPFDNTGESYIIDPRGEVIAGPAKGEAILIAEGSMEAVMAAKVATDIGGHYSRPDQLQLHVDGRPLRRIVENETAVGEIGTPLTGSEQQADDDPNDQRKTRLALAG